MLERVFERISTENVSSVLRRSAGIPPAILAILRSEPAQKEPVLLQKAMDFLINIVEDKQTREDSKVHALNILRFIFQDSTLKHDLQQYVTKIYGIHI